MVKFLHGSSAALLLSAIALCSVAHAEEINSVSIPPINPSPTSQQIPGKIIWHDLVTTNIKESQRFYAVLFGWKFRSYGTGKDTYYLITHRGKPVGGLVPLTEKQAAENDNQWISYISVPDVVGTKRYVKKTGGRVLLEPMQFKQQGELAVFADPEGALFGVLKSSSGDPVDAQGRPGEWAWANLMVNSPEQAIKFYQGIASYLVKEDFSHPQVKDYYLLTGKTARAGVVPLPAGKEALNVSPNWLPYIHVANINAAVVKTRKHGGRVILKPSSRIYSGKLAIIADPGDAALGLVELPATIRERTR